MSRQFQDLREAQNLPSKDRVQRLEVMAQRVKKYGTEAMQTEMLVIQTSLGPGTQAEKCVYVMQDFQRVKLLSEWCPKDPRNAPHHFITTSAPETYLKTLLVGVEILDVGRSSLEQSASCNYEGLDLGCRKGEV